MLTQWRVLTALAAMMILISLPVTAQEFEIAEEVEIDDDAEMEFTDGHGGQPMMGMMEELNLSKDQAKQMHKMRIDMQKQMIPLRAQVKVMRIELQELIHLDAAKVDVEKKIDQISKIRTDIAKSHANHRLAMRKLLTAEQKEQLDNRPHWKGKGNQGNMEKIKMRFREGKGRAPRGRGL